jgi:hypothetical protein
MIYDVNDNLALGTIGCIIFYMMRILGILIKWFEFLFLLLIISKFFYGYYVKGNICVKFMKKDGIILRSWCKKRMVAVYVGCIFRCGY